MSHRKRNHSNQKLFAPQSHISNKSKSARVKRNGYGGDEYHYHYSPIPNVKNAKKHRKASKYSSQSSKSRHSHSTQTYEIHNDLNSSRYSVKSSSHKAFDDSEQYLSNIMESDNYSDEYEEYELQHQYSGRHKDHNNSNIDHLLKTMRSEYELQMDHVIGKWKELLDRSQIDVEKYRNVYHSERSLNKKLQQTVDALRSKLIKYKNKDDENQIIIADLQRRLAEAYATDYTDASTTSHQSQTPRFYNYVSSQQRFGSVHKPKLQMLSSSKRMREKNHSFFTYSTQQSTQKQHTAKTPLKSSLPPPANCNHLNVPSPKFSLSSRGSNGDVNVNVNILPPPAHSEAVCPIHSASNDDMKSESDDDVILIYDQRTLQNGHRNLKTKNDLKAILDSLENGKNDEKEHENSKNECDKCISIIIKYKDMLFKNKTNTIKVSASINLKQFIDHLCDSMNINPNVIQLQHHANIMDTNSEFSLSHLGITNFDNICLYIDYCKLLKDDDEEMIDDEKCESLSVYNETLRLVQKCQSLIKEEHNIKTAKSVLMLRKSINLMQEDYINIQNKECLYSIIIDCVLTNNLNSMLHELSGKIIEIMQCKHVRIYFKWNNLVQIVYPQTANVKQKIVIDLNNDINENKSLLLDIIHLFEAENHGCESIKCFQNPAKNNKNFNDEFNKQFGYNIDSTIIAPLIFQNEQHIDAELIGIIQLINKENAFTHNDKQTLFPLTKVFANALKLMYHLSPTHKIFVAMNDDNPKLQPQQNAEQKLQSLFTHRMHRGVSRSNREECKPTSYSLSTGDHNIINVNNRHRSISHAASPILHDNISNASSLSSQPTPIFAPMSHGLNAPLSPLLSMKRCNRKRNESEHFHLDPAEFNEEHQQHSIIVDALDLTQEQDKITEPEQHNYQHKSRRSISHESPSPSSKSKTMSKSKSKSSKHRRHPSQTVQLVDPPSPSTNVQSMAHRTNKRMNIDENEEIQLLSLKPKHHNPPPKRVVTNKPDALTPDIVYDDPIIKCFLWSCIGVIVTIFIIVIHNYAAPDYDDPTRPAPPSAINHRDLSAPISSNPHIIWFIFDDLGQADYSAKGAEYDTPNIDYLVSDGIELSQHYVSPICSATRSSLLTGTYAYKMGLQGVMMDYVHPSSISHIPIKYKTIGNYLQSVGYDTRLYGKWHAGYSKKSYTPTHRGFNYHIGSYQYAINPFTKNNLDFWEEGKDWFINGEFNDNQQYSSDVILESILNDLDNYDDEKDDPLFMYIAFANPHFPVLTPDAFNEKHMDNCAHIQNEERRKYCFSVTYLDIAVGKIVDGLKANGMYDNSVIAMVGDNGPQILDLCGNPGHHIGAGSAYPLRGGKYTLFQGGVKTMAYISGGAINERFKGQKSERIMSAVDWLPTLLHFTTFYEKGRSVNKMDGIDLYDEIFDNDMNENAMKMSEQRKYLILSMEYDQNEKYVNTGIIYENHKLLINNRLSFAMGDGASCNLRSANPEIENSDFESIILNDGHDVPDLMLFDLEKDPNEFNDLLNGNGSQDQVMKDSKSATAEMIMEMLKILNHERKYNVPEMRTQSFEHQQIMEADQMPIPIDDYVLDGIHKPFQSEDEDEFPEGFNY